MQFIGNCLLPWPSTVSSSLWIDEKFPPPENFTPTTFFFRGRKSNRRRENGNSSLRNQEFTKWNSCVLTNYMTFRMFTTSLCSCSFIRTNFFFQFSSLFLSPRNSFVSRVRASFTFFASLFLGIVLHIVSILLI